ncbi:hypothetical protein VZ94_15510 [Methylocucumis oryzae]|uniref:histidine kinase n=2 Tax=Methylocucumis oryzae TaxID=1632867 RepID=A0A0F3IJR7_9GAMM|nr:hypothetical protein VZ94_15510 [Methylocucumis oryzae]
MTMTFMAWSEDYLTGIATVDEQHKTLVDMINASASLLAADCITTDNYATQLLDGLVNYVSLHFSTEDKLMTEQGIDIRHLQHHRTAHQGFAKQVEFLRQELDENGQFNGVKLLRFLSNWLAFHILGEDQRMAKQLKAIEQGHGPEQAYELIEGSKAEILQNANDVLVNALVNLFSQMTEQNRCLIEKNLKIEAANAELENYQKNLEQLVAARTAELTQAKNAAELSARAKNRFLGTVSHELLTPMNAILGFAHLLEQSDIPQKHREQAKRIISASEQLTAQLSEILQFSRLEAGDVETINSFFLPQVLLEQVVEFQYKVAKHKELSLLTYSDPDIPQVYCDVRLLRDAINILVNNAIKFTEHGFVAISAQLIKQEDNKAGICFEVKDTGIGIPLEKQKYLFQAFEQLDSTSTRRYQGVGLGLTLCARIIDLLGGQLTVESQPGKGSVFKIYLDLDINKTASYFNNPQDSRSLTIQLDEFKELLRHDNIEAKQAFRNLYGFFNTVDAQMTSELALLIERYEFDLALARVEKLLDGHELTSRVSE